MRAEDLQIGDLLRVNRDGLCIKKGTVVTVRGIDGSNNFPEKGLYGVADCRPLDESQFQGGIWLDYLDPIPLTPELLEKNGFGEQRFERMSVWSILGFSIELDFSTWKYYWANGDVEISSVHELQHALRICGIMKEIQI
ncbi:MAG: hypothetical protein IJK70_07625 [Bacteroidales bacterium]|nr:hypothetical protein [Bacteroidales bacterium]